MKKRLRLLAWVLTLTMLCELLPFGAFAQSDVGQGLASAIVQGLVLEEENGESVATGKCGDDLTWSLSSDGVLTIDGTGPMKDYDYAYYIHAPWYDHRDDIKSIIINYGVTHIGGYAFEHCHYLTSINIPDSVTSIGCSAFDHCSSLTSIDIPDSVIRLGVDIFYRCSSLTSINISKSLTYIVDFAFEYCTSLTSINIPKSVTHIYSHAFTHCTSLTSIYIPDSVTYIGDSAFDSCTSLQDVYYEGSQEQWNAITIVRSDNGNDNLLNATVHCQFDSSDTEKNEFLANDWFTFINSNDVKLTNRVPYGFTPGSKYFLFDESKEYLLEGLTPSEQKRVKKEINHKWVGSCFGMVSIAALRYVYPERMPLTGIHFSGNGEEILYNFSLPREHSENMDLINYYQMLQNLPTFINFEKERSKYCTSHTQEAIDDIMSELDKGHPVLACLKNHIVLLVGRTPLDDTSEYYMLRAFDPGNNSEEEFQLKKSSRSKIKINFKSGIPENTEIIKYNSIHCYVKTTDDDLYALDSKNYYRYDSTRNVSHFSSYILDMDDSESVSLHFGSDSFVSVDQEGNVAASADLIDDVFQQFIKADTSDDGTSGTSFALHIPKQDSSVPIEMELSSTDEDGISLLLENTFLTISADNPTSLTYSEQDHTLDVTSDAPTTLSLSFTQNETSESWPWHSWAIDTTDTTEFHAKLDDDGLHLSGDGLANAKYATEDMTNDKVDSGELPDGATNVTIVSTKDTDGNKTEVKPDSPTEPSEPDEPGKHNVSISGGTITQINDDVLTEPVLSCDTKEGDIITITADTENNFSQWNIDEGNISLVDASSPTTSFTMKDTPVRITAQYSGPTPTPTPTPGGGGSSGGGGGGGGAAIVLGVGVAAAVTAGVILAAPVEVKGRVELADHSTIAGAKVSLLQNGSVVAQTTADENGTFSLKAKRGSYELTVAYTDANGQIIHKTISIKAPAKDLTITF